MRVIDRRWCGHGPHRGPVECRGRQQCPGEIGGVPRLGEPARSAVDDLRQGTEGERGHGGPTRHRLRGDQTVGLLPGRGHQRDQRGADDRAELGLVQVAEVADGSAETGGDVGVEVRRIQNRPGQPEPDAGPTGRVDGQVGSLLRDDPARPDRFHAPGPRPPPLGVHAVQHRGGIDHVGPGAGGVLTDRDERARSRSERHGRLQPRDGRGVQGGHHRDLERGCHRDGQVVQAVVVDTSNRHAPVWTRSSMSPR